MPPKQLKDHLCGHKINRILQHISDIALWQKRFHQAITVGLREHCQVMTVQNSRLVVQLCSPIWAIQLRSQLPDIIATWQKRGWLIEDIQLRVVPEIANQKPTVERRHLSANAKQHLRMCSQAIKHPQLREALAHLSRDDE